MKFLIISLILICSLNAFSADIKKKKVDSPKPVTQVQKPVEMKKAESMDVVRLCLNSMYLKQIAAYRKDSKYLTSVDELNSETELNCRDIDLSVDMATASEFKMSARSKLSTWLVDQNHNFLKKK